MNRPSDEYHNSDLDINKKDGISALPGDLYESNVIDWLQDEVDTYDFHSDEEFLDFIKDSGFDKIYHISIYAHDIDKYKDIKSVYDLLSRYKNAAGFGKLQIVIFRKGKDKYLSKEETDKMISEYADEYLRGSKKTRKQMVDVFKDSYDVSNLSDENVRKKLVEALNQEPLYSRIISDGGKYKYLVGGGKGSKANSGKYYIEVLKSNGVDMIEIE